MDTTSQPQPQQQEPQPSFQNAIAAQAYRDTQQLLLSTTTTTTLSPPLAPLASMVRVQPLHETPVEHSSTSTSHSSLLTPNRGHHALFAALEALEQGFEQHESQLLQLESSWTLPLTTLVMQPQVPYHAPQHALSSLQALSNTVPRRVCQHAFRKNDIVWVCRTCQADETCVLCHACFQHSHHEGHDVAFYHAQAGGCCDCGDPDAWNPNGFCPKHGKSSDNNSNLGPLSQQVLTRTSGVVPALMDWMVQPIAQNAILGHERVKSTVVSSNNNSSNNKNSNHTLFDPQALQSTKLLRKQQSSTGSSSDGGNMNDSDSLLSHAQQLGQLGQQHGGLFLVVSSDDLHTTSQWTDALRELLGTSSLYTDSILHKWTKRIQQVGQCIVWGTCELLDECSATHGALWQDGDRVASGVIGTAMLSKAAILQKHGLSCQIVTYHELVLEQRAISILQWLTCVARSCDPLCQCVAEHIESSRHLVPLLQADFQLSSRITHYWHSLLLTLLAVPAFKSALAAAYCDTYRQVTQQYARGRGVLERSGYALSVQFLNRTTYVEQLVQHRNLLGQLGQSLLDTLQVACDSTPNDSSNQPQPPQRLNPNHFCLTHRRYSPCISDLKCVLNVKGMPQHMMKDSNFLNCWLASLKLGQCMDPQVWRTESQGHVELEGRGWVGAFNASISLGSLFERLLSWDNDNDSNTDNMNSNGSVVDLTRHVLCVGLGDWQRQEMKSYDDSGVPSNGGLPCSTIATNYGTPLAFQALPISVPHTPVSFHLPLHRFAAACIRQVCLLPHPNHNNNDSGADGIQQLLHQIRTQCDSSDALFLGLMEFPLLVLSRAAQVRAGLWKRNGPSLNDQVLNYAEPPFCRAMRDADILLVQCAMLSRNYTLKDDDKKSDAGPSLLVQLLLHRLGIFEFCGCTSAPHKDIQRYWQQESLIKEQQQGLALNQAENEEPTTTTTMEQEEQQLFPWTITDSDASDAPARKDAAASLLLLEECLHLLIVIVTELPPVPPQTKQEHTIQAKQRLRREVVHRLASGPKTHSELAEVHHVLSHWDNVYLSDEGKRVNPDDATGAALGAVLSEIAVRKPTSHNRMEPDQWELQREAWDGYDPSFFHISQRAHQTAAERRPNISVDSDKNMFGIEAKSLAPHWTEAHPSFKRIRRDITSDATVLAILYRTLHTHCSTIKNTNDLPPGPLSLAYTSAHRSETALAKAVHLLTLGAFAWQETVSSTSTSSWREQGGGAPGSVFFDWSESSSSPSTEDWIQRALLVPPNKLLASEWYQGEACTLELLKRLAVDGGSSSGGGGFVAQDRAVRAGAAWLCEFSVKHSPDARKLLGSNQNQTNQDSASARNTETELEKRKRMAKEKAMERMKAQAARFASMMETELDDGNKDTNDDGDEASVTFPTTPQSLARQGSFGSIKSSASSLAGGSATSDSERPSTPFNDPQHHASGGDFAKALSDDNMIPPRLLHSRPQCIICSDDSPTTTDTMRNRESSEEEGGRKSSRRRRIDGGNALAFVGYTQASTVLKGGGGAPPLSSSGTTMVASSMLNPVSRFVGTHVALCGHAVHSECWESYLASVSHREDRTIGKRDEFRCPLCQRLSNCLVPFIDVGSDWIEPATCCVPVLNQPKQNESMKSDGGSVDDSMNLEEDTTPGPLSVHEFLSCTPWWVSKLNQSLTWDGQCAFISDSTPSSRDTSMEEGSEGPRDSSQSPTKSSPRRRKRRSVRALRKKDLYAAWNAMMRTPRFVRRKARSKSQGDNDTSMAPSTPDGASAASPSLSSGDSTSGETVVWRRFMDQVSDISYRADGKRLGDENLHNDFGEFRHYIVEKYSYNLANRFAGREASDWPSCVFSSTSPPISDVRRQELSREKLLSKLMMSIQAFTYSCNSEFYEARRLIRRASSSTSFSRGAAAGLTGESTAFSTIFSKFGISGVLCDGNLVLMPVPSSQIDEGGQPFSGRLGRLRYLGLAVMAGAGAVAADIVQLCLQFPVGKIGQQQPHQGAPQRAPIVYPILFGHVLTHVVAAVCASLGRDRARSDSLDLNWPIPFSSQGSFIVSAENSNRVDSVVEDCEGFLKLGLLARILQVLLGKIDMASLENIGGIQIEPVLLQTLSSIRNELLSRPSSQENSWALSCANLLQTALLGQGNASQGVPTDLPHVTSAIIDRFHEGCSLAAAMASSYLADAGSILQLLLPGIMARYGDRDTSTDDDIVKSKHDLQSFEKLRQYFLLESLSEMLESSNVAQVVTNWYESARSHAKLAAQPRDAIAASRLYRTQGFRVFDWPLESSRDVVSYSLSESSKSKSLSKTAPAGNEDQVYSYGQSTVPMEIESPAGQQVASSELVQSSPSLVTFSAKKSVPLIGGYAAEMSSKTNTRPRVAVIPTSYTDLYAELGQLLPNCEQTAVCLICGEVLNAGGKGECTRHSYKCGSGTGMFFLLQECAGLIMHNGKAAYIHSPYVDSHGETPQYRGRPLNLDMERYEHLHAVWSGHVIRQQVLAERGSSRQVIVPDFY